MTRSPRPPAQRGMSLIEIIIVIVLIGAVLAFVGTRVLGGKDRGDYNIAKAQIQTMAGKVESFQMDTGRLPTALDELVTQPSDVNGWLGPYAKPAELKDPWGHRARVPRAGRKRPFDLVSLGKDGKPGGTSVDGDIKYE